MVGGGFWPLATPSTKVLKVAVTACKLRNLYFPKHTVFHLISMHENGLIRPFFFKRDTVIHGHRPQ